MWTHNIEYEESKVPTLLRILHTTLFFIDPHLNKEKEQELDESVEEKEQEFEESEEEKEQERESVETQSLFDATLLDLDTHLSNQLRDEVTQPYDDHISIVTPKIDDIKRWVVEEPVDRAEGDTDIQKLLDSWEA